MIDRLSHLGHPRRCCALTKIVALSGGPVNTVSDLRARTLALGSRESGHAAILPVHFLEQHGLVADRDYTSIRFDSDVGKHGDPERARWK